MSDLVNDYVHQPTTVKAVRLTIANHKEVSQWLNVKQRTVTITKDGVRLYFVTKQGVIPAKEGDWIFQDLDGKFYIADSEIFRQKFLPLNVHHDNSEPPWPEYDH